MDSGKLVPAKENGERKGERKKLKSKKKRKCETESKGELCRERADINSENDGKNTETAFALLKEEQRLPERLRKPSDSVNINKLSHKIKYFSVRHSNTY
jgi:hypothetical protein